MCWTVTAVNDNSKQRTGWIVLCCSSLRQMSNKDCLWLAVSGDVYVFICESARARFCRLSVCSWVCSVAKPFKWILWPQLLIKHEKKKKLFFPYYSPAVSLLALSGCALGHWDSAECLEFSVAWRFIAGCDQQWENHSVFVSLCVFQPTDRNDCVWRELSDRKLVAQVVYRYYNTVIQLRYTQWRNKRLERLRFIPVTLTLISVWTVTHSMWNEWKCSINQYHFLKALLSASILTHRCVVLYAWFKWVHRLFVK